MIRGVLFWLASARAAGPSAPTAILVRDTRTLAEVLPAAATATRSGLARSHLQRFGP